MVYYSYMQELFYNRAELDGALKVGGDTRSFFDIEAYRRALDEIQLFRKKDRHRKQESAVLSFEDKKFFEVGKENLLGEVKVAFLEVQGNFKELLKISNGYDRVRAVVDTQ